MCRDLWKGGQLKYIANVKKDLLHVLKRESGTSLFINNKYKVISTFLCLLERRAEVRFTALKQEGNDFVKKGQYQDALGKYTECLKLKPEECSIYTNRSEAAMVSFTFISLLSQTTLPYIHSATLNG